MNKFEQSLLEQFGEGHLRKVQSVKVGIAGAGGLGSNCAFNLVRAGVKNLKIVDFDKVEYSNLNRQFYFIDQAGKNKVEALSENLKRINPDIAVDLLVDRVEAGNIEKIFSDCDIVVEAFDRAEYKKMFVETLMNKGKFLVSASGLVGIGDSDKILVNRIKDDLVVIGDLASDSGDVPPISPRVNIAAAKQADVVLEHILKEDMADLT